MLSSDLLPVVKKQYIGCPTNLAVYEYNEAFDLLHIYGIEIEIVHKGHLCVGEIRYAVPGYPDGLLATSKQL